MGLDVGTERERASSCVRMGEESSGVDASDAFREGRADVFRKL